MDEKICLHVFVLGRVQGVWFRASTQKEAQKLKLTGWVRNLPDGCVEVLIAGEKKKVDRLREWLQKGPPLAIVKEVNYEELPWKAYDDFRIL